MGTKYHENVSVEVYLFTKKNYLTRCWFLFVGRFLIFSDDWRVVPAGYVTV